MTGTGVILISMLMAAGVQGAALIATDAVISTADEPGQGAAVRRRARGSMRRWLLTGVLVGLCTRTGRVRRARDPHPHAAAAAPAHHGGGGGVRRFGVSVARL